MLEEKLLNQVHSTLTSSQTYDKSATEVLLVGPLPALLPYPVGTCPDYTLFPVRVVFIWFFLSEHEMSRNPSESSQ